MADSKSALFVCLGNTCRSPIAQAVFEHLVKLKGCQDSWEVDSAAIANWHVGDFPNERARAVLDRNLVHYDHRARQIQKDDFNKFDYIFGMDEYNISDLKQRAPPNCKGQILLLGDFDPEGDRIIIDPYCDVGTEGFDKCFEQSMRCCTAFLKQF